MIEPAPTPLISCLCVTRARVPLLKRAVACFHAQTYPQKELVLLYEHDDRETAAFIDTLDPHRKLHLKEEPGSETWTQEEQGDPGSDLFVMTAACVRAAKLRSENRDVSTAFELADEACRLARLRIRGHFRTLFRNEDVNTYRIAQRAMEGRYAWLEKGIVSGPSSVSEGSSSASPEGSEGQITSPPSEVPGTAGVA